MHKRILLEALRRIRDEGAPIRSGGICRNAAILMKRHNEDRYFDNEHRLLYELVSQCPALTNWWPFPVEGAADFYNDQEAGTLWQNPRRIELLNWLIVQLENE